MVRSFIFDAGNVFLGILTRGMTYLTSGGVIVEGNCFIHVYEKFKENRYVQAVMLTLFSWTWKLLSVQRFCL